MPSRRWMVLARFRARPLTKLSTQLSTPLASPNVVWHHLKPLGYTEAPRRCLPRHGCGPGGCGFESHRSPKRKPRKHGVSTLSSTRRGVDRLETGIPPPALRHHQLVLACGTTEPPPPNTARARPRAQSPTITRDFSSQAPQAGPPPPENFLPTWVPGDRATRGEHTPPVSPLSYRAREAGDSQSHTPEKTHLVTGDSWGCVRLAYRLHYDGSGPAHPLPELRFESGARD